MIRTLTLLSALAVAPLSAQSILTVDDDPGADHTSIQAAVIAAGPLDLILVHPGVYDGINVPFSRTIVALEPGVTISGSIRVATDASERVVIRGIDQISVDFDIVSDGTGLSPIGDGIAWIEDSRLIGQKAVDCAPSDTGAAILVGVSLQGFGPDPFLQGGAFPGLYVEDGTVFALNTVSVGGPAKLGETSGGAGAWIKGGTLRAQGGRLQGGPTEAGFGTFPFCELFGQGGIGLWSWNSAVIDLVDCPPLGGEAPQPWYETCAAEGSPIALPGGTTVVTQHPGTVATIEVDSVLVAGDTAQLVIEGPADATPWLIIGSDTSPFFLPKFGSSLVVTPTLPPVQLAAIPTTGELALVFTVPRLPPGVPFQSAFVQVALHDGTTTTLGDASFVTLVQNAP